MKRNNDTYLNKIIKDYNLNYFNNIKNFIINNPLFLNVDELSRISEIANTQQISTAAYYTDPLTVKKICEYLPDFNQPTLRILEPSVGVGNIIRQVIKKYKDYINQIEIDLFDVNHHSLEICNILIEKEFGKLNNVTLNYINADFLNYSIKDNYDLVVGNPPFIKLKGTYLTELKKNIDNSLANNSAAFFLEKSINLSKNVSLILPKYFLHNEDFSITRLKIKELNINTIIDFGESGFKGILIETIGLFINTKATKSDINKYTNIVSIAQKTILEQKQSDITNDFFPNWLIYINDNFKIVTARMSFNIFKVFRDRQITSRMLNNIGDIRVLKSKNIPRNGEKILQLPEESYISKSQLVKLSIQKYFKRDDVFLSPNMTYYPRVVRKPKNCIVNGSVAILELKEGEQISDNDLVFFASKDFENFYRIARNYSTRSLNIDNISIFYFGKKICDVKR